MLPSLLATIAVIPPVEVTAAVTRARVVIHAGHIARLLAFIWGFHLGLSFIGLSFIVRTSLDPTCFVTVMRQFYRRGWKPWE